MIRKLDRRGVAALEFCIIAVPLFFLMFAIFDFGRYAITMQSLRALANAGSREIMVQRGNLVDADGPISCYAYSVKHNNLPTVCTGDPLPSDAAKQAVAPFLYSGGLTPTLNAQLATGALAVTASQPGFTMLTPIWGTAFNAPSASTSIPF
jgi:Flp pilus assembly protein TadG